MDCKDGHPEVCPTYPAVAFVCDFQEHIFLFPSWQPQGYLFGEIAFTHQRKFSALSENNCFSGTALPHLGQSALRVLCDQITMIALLWQEGDLKNRRSGHEDPQSPRQMPVLVYHCFTCKRHSDTSTVREVGSAEKEPSVIVYLTKPES